MKAHSSYRCMFSSIYVVCGVFVLHFLGVLCVVCGDLSVCYVFRMLCVHVVYFCKCVKCSGMWCVCCVFLLCMLSVFCVLFVFCMLCVFCVLCVLCVFILSFVFFLLFVLSVVCIVCVI